jgi:hypothetical protein
VGLGISRYTRGSVDFFFGWPLGYQRPRGARAPAVLPVFVFGGAGSIDKKPGPGPPATRFAIGHLKATSHHTPCVRNPALLSPPTAHRRRGWPPAPRKYYCAKCDLGGTPRAHWWDTGQFLPGQMAVFLTPSTPLTHPRTAAAINTRSGALQIENIRLLGCSIAMPARRGAAPPRKREDLRAHPAPPLQWWGRAPWPSTQPSCVFRELRGSLHLRWEDRSAVVAADHLRSICKGRLDAAVSDTTARRLACC